MHNIADTQTSPLQVRPGRVQPLFDDPVGLLVIDCDSASRVEMPLRSKSGAVSEGLVGLTIALTRH